MIVVIVERQIVLVENRAGLAGAEGVKRAAQHGYAGDFGQLVQRCKILFLPCQGIGFTGLRIILPDWIEPQAGINGLMHIDNDDNAETVANRIEVYEAQTMPLIEYYEKAGNIAHIDGATGLENVFADIVAALGE